MALSDTHEHLPSQANDEIGEAGPSSGMKRLLCAEPLDASPSRFPRKSLSLGLFVSWHTLASKSRHHCLSLKRLSGVEELQGLARDLMQRAFSPGSLPPHLGSPASSRLYYHFTPDMECLSLPSDVARTTLKLVVTYDGWEYVVYERPLRSGAPLADDADTPLLVTVVEFESTALVIGHLGIRVQLVSYPMVSVRKDFIDDIDFRLRTDPDNFKGILS
ncbi:hypothetical protein Agub_g2495 [Astrephomene gubernaculifera]|uniref:Uncharacterized protein n=1 Tax=Astrephomene gubernaculifera TaxID=47775 RepID=A0AAD3DJU6_9CHLO|nr:hypothetical protein Agub_g2495 [Astrephomene gubernaculifera]